MGEKEEKDEKGREIALPHFFSYNLTTVQQCIVAATYTRSTVTRDSSYSL